MNQGNFKKGSIGQKYVEDYFKGKAVIYWTDEGRSHPFDGIILEWEDYDIIAVEIKTKSARTHYKDTGFDIHQYKRLVQARNKYGKDPYCIFVDEGGGFIYGNKLSILERKRKDLINEYPLKKSGIIYFPLRAMTKIATLSDREISELRSLSNRNLNYGYPSQEWYDELDKDAL